MDISKIQIKKVEKTSENDKVLAIGSCCVENIVYVTGIKIIDGSKGLFVNMPQRKTKTGEWKDVCYPASKEVREEFNKLFLEEYNKL